ncbi:hypothetical protein GmHk_06G016796 [Glycine max]|nr:hypothetical protein GmHk_06G016796 [Glycine max]
MQQFLPGMVMEKKTFPMPPQGGQAVEGFVDGTWLYSKYKGTLLVEIVPDGNHKILPIAFAIIQSEIVEDGSSSYKI